MKKNAVVVCARCYKQKKLFGIRTEKRGNSWFFTWAFPIKEAAAKREGFSETSIEGNTTEYADEYPGCPYCKQMEFIYCGNCGKISCFGNEQYFTCPSCNSSGEVTSGWDGVNLSGGGH